MPGNIVVATCGCGYEKELSPGFAFGADQSYSIAYNQGGNELDTFEEGIIDRDNLERVADPFAMSDEDDDFIDSLDPDNIKPEEMDKLSESILGTDAEKLHPIKCPSCKNISLFLHHRGHWD